MADADKDAAEALHPGRDGRCGMKRPAAFALSLLAFQPFAWALYAWTDLPLWQFVALCALVGVWSGVDAVLDRRLAGGAR